MLTVLARNGLMRSWGNLTTPPGWSYPRTFNDATKHMEKMFAAKEMVMLATMSNMAVYLYMFVFRGRADFFIGRDAQRGCFRHLSNIRRLGVALGQQDVKTSVYAVLSLCSLIMFAFFVILPMLYWIVKITPKGKSVKESYVIAILLLLFLMGLTTDTIGASFGMVSVIMGFLIPDGWPLGYFTNLSAIKNQDELMMYGAMTIAGCLGRPVACLFVSSSMKLSKRSAVLLSLILRCGINSIHSMERFTGYELGHLGRLQPLKSCRLLLAFKTKKFVPIIIRLLEALNPKEISPISAYVTHLFSVASQSVPTLASYKSHLRKFNQPSSSDNIIRAFLNYVEKSQG
ncbi:hypothetical protein Goari_003660, partial [Gossypium aridum]|nr:hypothetical protein [Gossypium aridum]